MGSPTYPKTKPIRRLGCRNIYIFILIEILEMSSTKPPPTNYNKNLSVHQKILIKYRIKCTLCVKASLLPLRGVSYKQEDLQNLSPTQRKRVLIPSPPGKKNIFPQFSFYPSAPRRSYQLAHYSAKTH